MDQLHRMPGKGMGTKESRGMNGDSAIRNFLPFRDRVKSAFACALALKLDLSLAPAVHRDGFAHSSSL